MSTTTQNSGGPRRWGRRPGRPPLGARPRLGWPQGGIHLPGRAQSQNQGEGGEGVGPGAPSPRATGPRLVSVLGASSSCSPGSERRAERAPRTGRGRGSGCAFPSGRQGAAAADGRRRPSPGAGRQWRQRTLAAPAPGTRTPSGVNQARPSVAASALRVPPIGHAWKLPSLWLAGRWQRRQHPSPGAQAGREAAAAGGARPPRGSQQWCAALARSPRPPGGLRGSGRETPPATRSPEFARLASRAGAAARQRPRRLSPEHGAGAWLALIAPFPPPLTPPVPLVPPAGAASGFWARGSTTVCLSKESGR